MQTRHKASTQRPRTAEVQKQIKDDAKLARRINMLPRSPTKKENNGIPRSQIRKPSITSRRLAFDRGAGLKGTLRKDARLKKAQAQAGDISVVAAVEQSQAHNEDSSSSGDSEQELETTPRGASKRLRSLFQAKALADRENNKRNGDDDKEGEQDQPPQNSVNLDSKETHAGLHEREHSSINPSPPEATVCSSNGGKHPSPREGLR